MENIDDGTPTITSHSKFPACDCAQSDPEEEEEGGDCELNKPGLVQTSGENLVFKYLYDNILDWLTLTFSGKGEMILILASFSPADLFLSFPRWCFKII